MSMEDSLWGASRVHGELLKLGYELAQSTVSKYMARGWYAAVAELEDISSQSR